MQGRVIKGTQKPYLSINDNTRKTWVGIDIKSKQLGWNLLPQGTTFQVLNSEAGVQERSGLVTPLDHSITQLNGQPEPSCGHGCLEFTTFFSILLDFQDNRCWYVNLYSDPDTASLPDLAGGVFWHTQHWVGAVLATAQLETDKSHQIKTFLNSAIAIGRTLLL